MGKGKSKSAASKAGGGRPAGRPNRKTTKLRGRLWARQQNIADKPNSGGVGNSASNKTQAARRRAAEVNSGAAESRMPRPAPEKGRMKAMAKGDAAAVKAAKSAKKKTPAQEELANAAAVRKTIAKGQKGKVNEKAKPRKERVEKAKPKKEKAAKVKPSESARNLAKAVSKRRKKGGAANQGTLF